MWLIIFGIALLVLGVVTVMISFDMWDGEVVFVLGAVSCIVGVGLLIYGITGLSKGSTHEVEYFGSGKVTHAETWKTTTSSPYKCGKSTCIRTSTHYQYQYVIEMEDGRTVAVFSKDKDNSDLLWGADIPVHLSSSNEKFNYEYQVGDFVSFKVTVRYPNDKNDDSYEYVGFEGSNSIDQLETPVTSSTRKN